MPPIEQNPVPIIQEKPHPKWKPFLITGVLFVLITASGIYIKSPKYKVLCGSTTPTTCIEYVCSGILLSGISSPQCYFGTLQPMYPDTSTPLGQVDETTNWKTYTNKEFDVEVKYPETWIVRTAVDNTTGKIASFSINEPYGTDELNAVNFLEPYQNAPARPDRADSVSFSIQRGVNPAQLPIKKWYDTELGKYKESFPNYSASEIKVSGEPAVQRKYTGSFGNYYNVFVSVNKTDILTISHISQAETSLEALGIFSSIKLHPDVSYALYEMTDKSIIRIESGKVGEKVYLLKNPEFRELGENASKVTIPLAPKNPVWESVPNGTYTTIFGPHYFIQDSKIVRVTDKNGNIISE